MLHVQTIAPLSHQGFPVKEECFVASGLRLAKCARPLVHTVPRRSKNVPSRPSQPRPNCCVHPNDGSESFARSNGSSALSVSRRMAGILLIAACLEAPNAAVVSRATAMPLIPLTDDPENMSSFEVERLVKRVGEFRMPDKRWRELLSSDAYGVMRLGGTEPRFSSQLAHEARAGSFLCKGCSSAVFRSEHKYDSGSGWPSFMDAIPGSVAVVPDNAFGFWEKRRPEVRCRRCQSHLGHILTDGPPPSGLRYCMNGVALLFRPDREFSPDSAFLASSREEAPGLSLFDGQFSA